MANEFDSDMVDLRIEKRLALLQDGLELKLIKALDEQFKNRFESAIKLLGWAFGLIALIFTVFGIKTTVDLREAAKTTAIEEVKKKLAIEDPNSDFRRDVNRIVSRGVINSYFLEMARQKGKRFAPEIRVADVDIQRLMEVVKDFKSDNKDFRDAVEILARSNYSREGNNIDRFFLALASADEDEFKWMRAQAYKRASIFDLFMGDALITSAKAIASDNKSDKRLIIATTKYLARQKDKDAVRIFERLVVRSDEQISKVGLDALAKISPESKFVSNALTITPEFTSDSVVDALRLAAIVLQPSSRGFLRDDPNAELRMVLASNVLREAIIRNFVFRLSEDLLLDKSGIAVSNRKSMSRMYGVPSNLIVNQKSELLSRLIHNAPDANQVLKILRAVCLEQNEYCQGVVQATLNEGAKVRLSNGLELGPEHAPAGVFFRPKSTSPESEILVSWTDQDAIRKTLILDRFINSKSISFILKPGRALTEDEISEE